LMGYLKISKGKAAVTPKGEAKLKAFKKTLTKVEKKALQL
jgi:hypothetical protein